MSQSESQLQAQCVTWLWNEHPETRGLFFAVNNNSEHVARAMQRRAIGLIPGVSDDLFMWHQKLYCFEFKTETGRQSPAQISWEKKVTEHGFDYYIIRNFETFQHIIMQIICSTS